MVGGATATASARPTRCPWPGSWTILDALLERNQDRVVWGGRWLSQQPAWGGRPFPIRMRNIKDVMFRVSGWTRPAPPPAPGLPAAALPPPDALTPVAASPAALVLPGGWQIEGLPDIILRAGPQAAERTVEFFTAQIRNPHTRAAYGTAVTRFFTWCDARGLELEQISPIAGGHLHRRDARPVSRPHDQAASGRPSAGCSIGW